LPEALFSEEFFPRALYDRMGEAYALHELILSPSGVPVDYRFLDANPAFFDILHLTREGVVGKTALQLWPNLEPLWLSRYTPVALGGEDTAFEEHSKALGKWFKVRAFNAGPRRFGVLFQDVTERKRAEEEKTVLLQEVQHRVKNNLQIIISLIQFHLIAASDLSSPVFMKTLQSRIYAIASVHDVLSASAVNDRVSLAALLRTLSGFCCTLTDIFPRLSDIRIEAEEDTQLPLQTAIPVALVVHECILDAVRRAPAEGGELFLSIVSTALEKDRCRITILHPFKKIEASKDGVGTMLLEGLVDQIRGILTEVLESQGQWVFDFPIEGAGRPIYPT
jgi:PAS domain S-box-containing protein